MPYPELIIPGLFTIIVAGIYVIGAREKGLREIESHKQTIKRVKGFDGLSLTFDQQMRISEGVQQLFAETNIDRFFTLLAFNGRDKSRWVTAVLVFVDGKWQVGKYINFEIDDHYNAMLKKMRLGEDVCFSVADLPDDVALKKDIYGPEKVLCSKWCDLSETELGDGVLQILFCSLSSHVVDALTQNDKAHGKRFVDMYRGIVREAEAA